MDNLKINVLFVDDEPNILNGLKTRLYKMRDKWNMFFATSGNEALKLISENKIDVIVSDMKMPQMDGATLLNKVQEMYPDTIRIVLSGYADYEAVLRAIKVTHQYLSKPVDTNLLIEVVEKNLNLKKLLNNEKLQKAIIKIQNLPSIPETYSKLLSVLADESKTLKDVAEIIKYDAALTAKLLQIVNSAYYNLETPITNIEDAVVYLGLGLICNVSLSMEVFNFKEKVISDFYNLTKIQKHSINVACVASNFFDDNKKKEDAFVSGLLHDIGKTVMLKELPDVIEKIDGIIKKSEGTITLLKAEEGVLGLTHAELGAYLLDLWGVPYEIINTAMNHHIPERINTEKLDLVHIIHISDAIVNFLYESKEIDLEKLDFCDKISKTIIEKYNLKEKIPDCIKMAQQQIELNKKSF